MLIDVHDSGPGLSEEVSATLFEPTITFKKHGMGLGLSIAKKNALLSGGDVTVIPGELGGAGFRVSLPVMTRKRHIVIVDDEANIGRSLRLILEGEGYRVSVFDSTAAFLAERNRAAADLYLLDVRLPDGSGIDLLRLVRQWDDRCRRRDDLRARDGGRRRRGDEDRRVRLPREAARARPRAAGRQERARVVGPAAREPALPGTGRGRAEDDWIGPRVPARRAAGDAGGAIRRDRAAVGRVRDRARSCWPRTSTAKARLPRVRS